jgi:hypothetical protein
LAILDVEEELINGVLEQLVKDKAVSGDEFIIGSPCKVWPNKKDKVTHKQKVCCECCGYYG